MLLREMSQKMLALNYDAAPSLAQQAARQGVLDTIGVTLAGAGSDAARRVGAAFLPMAGEGPASIMGAERSVDPASAALLNGTASHAHDFDDCSNTLGGHPSAPILPALWALAEAHGASGKDLLSAYIAGVEVETRLGRAVNFHHYEKGWHPTSTLGTFGAAAACAHLTGLDADRAAVALALAASMASGLKANFGTMAKPYHVGHCARNGLSAALMAEAGLSANPGVLEHPQGFFAVYDENEVNAAACLDGWADPLDLVEPGLAFKRHPCCASTHPAIDALLVLREGHGLSWDDVRSIRSWTHPRRLRHTDRPDPQSGLEAKFSVQYVLTRALMRGRSGLEDFTDAAVADSHVRDLMSRVVAEPHPDAVMDSTEHFFAEVTVICRDGRELTARVERPLGRDRQHPLPEGALEAKFLDCAAPVIGDAAAGGLLEALSGLQDVGSIASLAPMVRKQADGQEKRKALKA